MGQEAFYNSIASYYEYIFPLSNQQVGFVQSEFDSLEEFFFLDVGCSTGQLANRLCQLGALGIGIDLNSSMIERARESHQAADLSFKVMDMMNINSNFTPGYFDALICFGNTLVHLDSVTQIRNFFQQSFQLLKPGGKLLFQILNYQYILGNKIEELPLIDNQYVRFERSYELPTPNQPKVNFKTKLFVKSENLVFENSAPLIPVQKNELEKLLLLAGFPKLHFYGGFDKKPCGDHLPLVVVAEV
ncbi:class I SAM-dependent methyltransferase [Mangrovibacterium diazotrophicum]|uniref:Methyltransferase family protein n=1 Tax=Mangrovibacterium diazotrophicum TaxID=1261403 RepID=A0A419VXG6_9BACT|nr:class I SAM-dependent methyltransferase [Mangrovibacterium diazotrophicum]RKD87917.1 methyltransferase family protein [Mangrovibacterium diazotrophicum]